MGDVLTDGLRSMILQICGYRTDLVEFVSLEHTGKNLMIRAVKTDRHVSEQLKNEYRELTEFWGVQPYLGELLGDLISS
jgi:hypothetical protein